jgi:hypothetical protein
VDGLGAFLHFLVAILELITVIIRPIKFHESLVHGCGLLVLVRLGEGALILLLQDIAASA